MSNKEIEILGPPVGITDILDDAINEEVARQQEEKKAGKARRYPLSPSSAGYCGRRLAYALNEYAGNAIYASEPMDPTQYRTFDLGNTVEFSTLRQFKLIKIFTTKYKQQSLHLFELDQIDAETKKQYIEGSCDLVIWSEKYRAVGDIKSKKDRFSAAYKTAWDEELEKFRRMPELVSISDTAFYADDLPALLRALGDDFLTDNLVQVNAYANTEFLMQRGVNFGFVYRLNKNDSRHMEIRFRPSKEVAESVRRKFNAVQAAVSKSEPTLVGRDYTLGSVRCAYCPYKTECWGKETNVVKAWWKQLPAKRWPTDTERLDGALASKLEEAFSNFEKTQTAADLGDQVQAYIVKLMVDNDLRKVRLSNGSVYELKYLKTNDRFEIRRSKA